MHELHLFVDLTWDRDSWRRLIHTLDYWFPLHILADVLIVLWHLLPLLLLLLLFSFLIIFFYLYLHCIYLHFMFKGHTWAIRCKQTKLPLASLDPRRCKNLLYFFLSQGTLWSRSPLSFMGMSCRHPSLFKCRP